MKFAFIFGKGIDGCGVTRGAMIFDKWLTNNGHTSVIYSFETQQSLGRGKYAKFHGEVKVVKNTEEVIPDKVIAEVNACDMAIFHSYPTRKSGPFCERFLRFVEKIDTLKVMHDHGVTSNTINAIPQAGEIFSHADVLVAQSTTGLTSRAFTTFDESLKGRVLENPIWFEPELIDQYDLPFEERRKVLNYVGRNSPIKQIGLIPAIIPGLLEHGWTGEMLGVERSINAISGQTPASPLQERFRHLIQFWGVNKNSISCRSNGGFLPEDTEFVPIYCKDYFEYSEGMTALGSCMASWAGYRLTDPSEYGVRMEYTQLEACLLTVPILNKDFVANAYSADGKLWGDHGCFISADFDSMEELTEDLIRLSNSPTEWTERHNCSKGLVSRLFDVKNLAPKFLENILSLGKKPEGSRGLDLVHWWREAKAHRSNGDIVMTTANSIQKQRKLILDGAKQKEFK